MYLASKKVGEVRTNRKFSRMENLNGLPVAAGNYRNDVVERLEKELGSFKYSESQANNFVVKEAKLLENGAMYQGQW